MPKITATEASRNWSDLLNRVRYKREAFAIERGGEVLARLEPAARPLTNLSGLVALLGHRKVDGGFADDLEAIVSERPELPSDPWAS
ncbi:MAG: hypothetical protein AAFY60_11535 [Myxococcota bacterium]